jgi:hypothetical protein
MREYATVLHLHKLVSSMPLGPVYEYPGESALMVNAAKRAQKALPSLDAKRIQHSQPKLHVDIKYAATVHAF